MLSGFRTYIDDPVGVAHQFQIVLDDEQRVARLLQLIQRRNEGLRVGRVQSRRGLIEHVHDAEEIRPDLGREPQALQLTG